MKILVLGSNGLVGKSVVKILKERIQKKDWKLTLDTFARCVRITRDLEKTYQVSEKNLIEDAEKALYKGVEKAESEDLKQGDMEGFFQVFTPLISPITDFFDNVLVMDEDQQVRENRLGLLQRITRLSEGTLDMSRLEGF